jgi:hypothetical protein
LDTHLLRVACAESRAVCLRPFVYPRTAEEPQKLFTFPLHSTAQARQAHASCRISCSCSGVDRSPPRKQMGRAPCCGKVGLKKGRWTREEDEILARYIEEHGEGSWRSLPKNAGTWIERPIDSEEMKREMVEKLHEHQASSLFANELRRLICGQSLSLPLFHSLSAGLLRCGKSCRLRWINYLRAGLKRGNITEEEEDVIVKLHATLGNRYPPISIYLSGIRFAISSLPRPPQLGLCADSIFQFDSLHLNRVQSSFLHGSRLRSLCPLSRR